MNAREKIITTTINLLFEKGFYGTRTNEILEQSKLSKGSFYYYFPDGKISLFVECLKLNTLELSLEYKKIFESTSSLEEGLNKIIEHSKINLEQSQYNHGSLLANISQVVNHNQKEIQILCKKLFTLILNTVENFFLRHQIETWEQSARRFLLELNGAIILSKTSKTTSFLDDIVVA
ncbi:MAG: hypothetical protein CMD35_08270 [Flavobacteriales bacterium]|nr:hypothetical protein [Flavobacteriales bacterium]|tara:strand:- start:166 stop:696 length:531 start_codon:yes stop_codon:yes gene_type:complete